MSYTVVTSENSYKVVEKGSGLVVSVYKIETDARNICRSLNLGSGFDGWTPPFFAAEYPSVQKEMPPN